MSFLRHGEIYRSDEIFCDEKGRGRGTASRWSAPEPGQKTRRKERVWLIVRDEFPAGYSLAGCSPAEPASASPTALRMPEGIAAGKQLPANGNLSLVSVSQPRGAVQYAPDFVSSLIGGDRDRGGTGTDGTFSRSWARCGGTG